jgi:hypothetical protein
LLSEKKSKTERNNFMKIQFLGVVLTTMALGCASKEQMVSSDVAPAARGELVVNEADSGNTALSLTVEHLAPAGRIDAGAKNYVVWMQPEGSNQFQNIGALTVDENLKGRHRTTVPYKAFRILVTPEPSGTVSRPSGVTIFDQSISR